MDPSSGIIIIITLVLSALFSGAESAFLAANRLKIALDSNEGRITGRILTFFTQRPSRFIGAMLLGNNAVLVIYGIFMAEWLEPEIKTWWNHAAIILLIQTLISTAIVLVFGEFLPKALFQSRANTLLGALSPLLALFYLVLWIPTILFIGLSEGILILFTGKKYGKETLVFNRMDLDDYVKDASGKIQDDGEAQHEIQIFKNALDFSKLRARDCMVPRTEITAIELTESIENLKDIFVETGYSKVLVYYDTIDNIVGYTHSYQLFRNPNTIKSILLPISFVPESIAADELLQLLISQSRAVAVVVDEYGGTAGIVTIEDIIEQIFGDIEDEHDKEELEEIIISENEYLFSGRLEIEELNEKYQLNLPVSEDYETLAGLIMYLTGEIPEQDKVIRHAAFEFILEKISSNRIEIVRIRKYESDI